MFAIELVQENNNDSGARYAGAMSFISAKIKLHGAVYGLILLALAANTLCFYTASQMHQQQKATQAKVQDYVHLNEMISATYQHGYQIIENLMMQDQQSHEHLKGLQDTFHKSMVEKSAMLGSGYSKPQLHKLEIIWERIKSCLVSLSNTQNQILQSKQGLVYHKKTIEFLLQKASAGRVLPPALKHFDHAIRVSHSLAMRHLERFQNTQKDDFVRVAKHLTTAHNALNLILDTPELRRFHDALAKALSAYTASVKSIEGLHGNILTELETIHGLQIDTGRLMEGSAQVLLNGEPA